MSSESSPLQLGLHFAFCSLGFGCSMAGELGLCFREFCICRTLLPKPYLVWLPVVPGSVKEAAVPHCLCNQGLVLLIFYYGLCIVEDCHHQIPETVCLKQQTSVASQSRRQETHVGA